MRSSWMTRLLGLLGLGGLVACSYALATSAARWNHQSGGSGQDLAESTGAASDPFSLAAIQFREAPLQLQGITFDAPSGDILNETFWEEVTRLPTDRIDASMLMHLQSMLGRSAKANLVKKSTEDKRDVSITAVLLNGQLSEDFLGNALLASSSVGIRVRDPGLQKSLRGAERHRDQLLAHLGGLGIPSSTTVEYDGRQGAVVDILRDSIAHFDIRQKELEWTALAYLHYLPPLDHWCNRFGARYSFDDIARELLGRPLVGASCNGIHTLIALSAFVQADDKCSLLNEETREIILDRLRQSLVVAIKMQQEEGCWNPLCIYRFPGGRRTGSTVTEPVIEDSLVVRQSITSHIVLWLSALPIEIPRPGGVQEKGGAWLAESIGDLTPREYWDDYCTMTHVLNAVQEARKSKD
jgi:hypothetical protein